MQTQEEFETLLLDNKPEHFVVNMINVWYQALCCILTYCTPCIMPCKQVVLK